ncbi:unnamed protein product [Chondrus crispus]|uniref:Uncharacterized protein n=1 Tax=Chondrus crispus TaxID=2769 RepID=R7QDL3_CHOCR|nr:unnamed protein product [Chondrus crispus]CDF36179.1 unnamed protein product [Chondrus crispus]|eukprot:XP_005715998.1 unnamed protein product [Chondrus crispus]
MTNDASLSSICASLSLFNAHIAAFASPPSRVLYSATSSRPHHLLVYFQNFVWRSCQGLCLFFSLALDKLTSCTSDASPNCTRLIVFVHSLCCRACSSPRLPCRNQNASRHLIFQQPRQTPFQYLDFECDRTTCRVFCALWSL